MRMFSLILNSASSLILLTSSMLPARMANYLVISNCLFQANSKQALLVSQDFNFLWFPAKFVNVGDTFILFNQQMKGNKRELIQLGVPIFGPVKEDAKSKNDEMIETNFNNLTYYLEQETDLVFLIVSANYKAIL